VIGCVGRVLFEQKPWQIGATKSVGAQTGLICPPTQAHWHEADAGTGESAKETASTNERIATFPGPDGHRWL